MDNFNLKQSEEFRMKRGMTLIEIVVVVGIFGLIVIGVTSFQRNVFIYNKYAQDSLTTAYDARNIIRIMVKEIRIASPSNNGSYPIAQAATSSFTFFSDANSDGKKEKIRYFISSNTLRKGVIQPVGAPATYPSANEVLTTLAYNVKNDGASPLFTYYDNTYTGTSSPLALPVNVTGVRLVKITLLLDVDPNKSPIPRSYTSQVTLRNIKDNL